MKIDLSDIMTSEDKEVSRQVELDLMSFDSRLGQFPIISKTPFVIQFTNESNKRLLMKGETEITIVIPCDRCLEDVERTFHIVVNKEIDLTGSDEEKSMECLDYMAGTSMDVDQLIFGEILTGWPMKVLCKEDCRGICKRCGANLNITECGCQKTEPDPRMVAIQDVFDKFKEV